MPPGRPPRKLDVEGLWDYALKALSQRPHSLAELGGKLRRSADSAGDVQTTLAKLREYGLADDRKFSEMLASSRLENQGFGRSRVLRELHGKRVPPQTAQAAVDQAFAGTDEAELISRFIARKYRGKALSDILKDEKGWAAAYRRLRTAGFTHSGSLAALKRLKNDIPDWEDPEEPAR